MFDTRFNCLPTVIGTMPHADPEQACRLVTRFLKDIPAWPQLPKRSFTENMYAQYSENFPGITVEDGRVYVKRTPDYDSKLEQLYAAYLANDATNYGVSEEYAAGLHNMLASGISPGVIKGHVTGPFSWGLTVTDEDKKSVIYDDTLGDAVPRFLRLKASWQENALSRVSKNTIIFVDEPYMASFGSAVIPISKDKVISLLEEVFQGISGLKGVHCCGNTDWSVLLGTSLDILSYDTYNYASSLALYPAEVKKLLDRKGVIAWGIVPNTEGALLKETAASLQDRLAEAIVPFTRKGVPFRQLIEQGLLTPSCGLEGISIEGAEQVLKLLTELSDKIRKKYAS